VVAVASLGLTSYNTRLEDLDQLSANCSWGFTGHFGFAWPESYPVPDSLHANYTPVALVECDLLNPGRRGTSVTQFSMFGRGPDDHDLSESSRLHLDPPPNYAWPDSTVLRLPFELAAGQAHRLRALLGLRTEQDGTLALYLLAPSGQASPFAFQLPDSLSPQYPPSSSRGASKKAAENRWAVDLRFATGRGTAASYTVSWDMVTGSVNPSDKRSSADQRR
jgi:hypothetical protein